MPQFHEVLKQMRQHMNDRWQPEITDHFCFCADHRKESAEDPETPTASIKSGTSSPRCSPAKVLLFFFRCLWHVSQTAPRILWKQIQTMIQTRLRQRFQCLRQPTYPSLNIKGVAY